MNKNKKRTITGFAAILLSTTLVASPIISELHQHNQVNKIKKSESIKNVPRSFKNIKQDDMGNYLKNTINYLYEKYPNLDDLIYLENEATKNTDLLYDIFLLYKAEMVDRSIIKNQEIDMDNIAVRGADSIINSSDRIFNEDIPIHTTYKDQDKFVTNKFVEEKRSGNYDAAELAKRIYEYLVLEHGLTENTLTSKQIQERIEKDGFYYDVSSGRFYTQRGIEKLQLIDDAELLPEHHEELHQDNLEEEPEL